MFRWFRNSAREVPIHPRSASYLSVAPSIMVGVRRPAAEITHLILAAIARICSLMVALRVLQSCSGRDCWRQECFKASQEAGR